MDWQQLKGYFDHTYDFLDRINVAKSLDEQTTIVHPLMKLSTGLALKAMSSISRNRFVVLLPNKLHCAQWIATLCTFEIMKKDYESGAETRQFSKGQKLMVNRCIVEYSGEEYISKLERRVMWVRCSNGSYGIPLDRKLAFQPVSTSRPLSSLERVSQAVSSAQRLDNPIDNILQTITMGNKGLFKTDLILVSRIGETERFLRQHYINGTSIVDLFLWGKLDTEGNATIIGSQQIQANPCCLISQDLNCALQYIDNNPGRNKGVIIDGSSNYFNNIQVLDEMLDQNVPVVVICDLMETEDLPLLTERDFRIWQWNKKNITQSGAMDKDQKSSPFSSLNDSIYHYCNQKRDMLLCEYPALNTVVEESIKLGRLIPIDQQQINLAYGKLIQLINELSRLVRIPEEDWTVNFLQKLQLLQQHFNSHQLWLSDKTIQCTDTIFGMLSDIAKKPFAGENHKVNRLSDFINERLDSNVIGVIVAKTEEIEDSLNYWSTLLPEDKISNIHFTTIPDLLEPNRQWSPDQIVVCGWLRGDRMYPLLHSHITSEITMLAYPFEQKWFTSAQRNWTKRNSFNIHAKDFSEILGLTEEELDLIEYEVVEAVEPVRKDDFDIFEFELKLKTYRYSAYASSLGTAEELCRAKLVVFSQNRFAFITESHRLPVVTDIMKGEIVEREIPRKHIEELRVGDYVLFQESNRDIIREIADKGLAKGGQSHLRKVAGLWKEALREAYWKMSGDFDGLVDLLRKVGCGRHPATIRNWLTDEDQIGPGISTDLQLIATATGNKTLVEGLAQVKSAISAVRGAHIQASAYIRSKLLTTLPGIVEGERGLPGYARESIQLNLDEFGQVTILRIEEIGDNWEEIAMNSVNYLLSEED
ncbi:DrmE family protein [Chloroflexota bacterium]